MWPFSRKKRVSLDTFCREFYDTNILNPIVAGLDVGMVFFDFAKRSVAEVDLGFDKVEVESFCSEMKLIRFEVFGLAWLHQLGEKHAAAQSVFTKNYLEERGHTNIWDSLQPYNQAIARFSKLGLSPETAVGRAYLAFRDSLVADFFDQWYSKGFDPKAVARAANRLSTDVAWKKGATAGFLTLTLCERLCCEVNEEAQFRLVAIISSLYDGAREAMKGIKIES